MIRTRFNHSPEKPATYPIAVVAEPSMEGFVEDMRQHFPQLSITFGESSLETQQLDNSKAQREEDDLIEEVKKHSDTEKPVSGPVQIFLLDNKGAAVSDDGSESTTLKALINATLSDPTRTVAALMPESTHVNHPDDLAPNTLLRQIAGTVLSTEGVTTLVGLEALSEFLRSPQSHMTHLESFKDEMAEGEPVDSKTGSKTIDAGNNKKASLEEGDGNEALDDLPDDVKPEL